MPTVRPRHAITETAAITHALSLAQRRWPGEPSSRLLTRLIDMGATSLRLEQDAARAERERAVSALAHLEQHYPDGYLEDVRTGWQE